MSPINVLLLVVLILAAIALLPMWPYSLDVGWGYFPSGILILALIVALVVMMSGRHTPHGPAL